MTTETERRYRLDGFVVIPAVFDPASVTACIEHLGCLQAGQRPVTAMVTAPLTRDRFLARLAGDTRLTNIAGCVLGAEPVPFGCTYFVKEAHCDLPVAWHQDGHPWQTRLGISEAVTLWLALDRSNEDTGGLHVIPGSHNLAAQPLRPTPVSRACLAARSTPTWWMRPGRGRSDWPPGTSRLTIPTSSMVPHPTGLISLDGDWLSVHAPLAP